GHRRLLGDGSTEGCSADRAASGVVAGGVTPGVGKDASIPADAWVIEGKGLTVYPGLVDALTDVGIPPAPAAPEGAPRRAEPARGPEDRPSSTPWRAAADEASLSDKRIETWRNAGFSTLVSPPQTRFFPSPPPL